MSGAYELPLDYLLWAILRVEFTTQGKEVTDYAVMLLYEIEGRTETIRLYDGAHGHNEMHRYTRSAASSRERPCSAVPLETECGPRSQRSRAATAR